MTRNLLCLLALCLLLPSAASASTTVGMDPDFVTGDDPITCANGCTLAQVTLAGIEQDVPEQGVVTSFRVSGANGTARLRRVAPSANGGRGGAASAAVTLTGAPVTAAAALPVAAGEVLAVELSPGARIAADASPFKSNAVAGWVPALADGTQRDTNANRMGWIAAQATIEPDRDGDGLGDESQDACVLCEQGPAPAPAGPSPDPAPAPAATTPAAQRATPDPYAAIRRSGPKVTFARTMQRTGKTVSLTVFNPYAFALSGKLVVRRGGRKVATQALKLAPNATKKLKVKVPKGVAKLALAATLKGPVGGSATTKASVKLGKPESVDGTYRGAGGGDAGWVMVIQGGVVKTFTGTMGLTCAKSKSAENRSFTNAADDPPATVAPDGSFSWEATSGYGLTKLKFTGRVAGGKVTGNAAVEYHPPVSGADPVSGMPRMEFDSCFGGRDYTLAR